MDMFASEFNSATGQQTAHMNLMNDSTILKAKQNKGKVNTSLIKDSSPSGKKYHAHKQTQEFSQSGFDLVDRINDPRHSQNHSMQDIVQLNDDLEDNGEANSSMQALDCDNCENYREKYL